MRCEIVTKARPRESVYRYLDSLIPRQAGESPPARNPSTGELRRHGIRSIRLDEDGAVVATLLGDSASDEVRFLHVRRKRDSRLEVVEGSR